MDQFDISVIIPTHKRPDYLNQAVMSVVNQTHQHIEVVIVNDGEPDDIQFPHSIQGIPIRVYHPDTHLGAGGSRNYGVSKARFDWIAFLDDDDLWAATKLEKQVGVILKDSMIQFIYHDHYIFDTHYRIYDRKQLSHHYSKNHNEFHRNLLIYSATGSTSSFLIHKPAFEKVNGFDEQMPSAQDHDLALRLFKAGIHFYCIPDPLLFYREHYNKISMNLENKLEGRTRILQTKRKLFPKTFNKYEADIQFFNHYALAFVYIFNRKGMFAFHQAIHTFRIKKRMIVLLKLLLLICLSKLYMLNPVRNLLSLFKQIKYRTASREFKNNIRSYPAQSLE